MELVFESHDLLIWNKPAGIHSTDRSENDALSPTSKQEVSMLDRVREKFPELRSITTSPHPHEYGLLYRLDLGTTGLIAFARSQNAYNLIRKNWKTPLVTKRYRALVLKNDYDASLELKNLSLPYRFEDLLAHSSRSKKKMVFIRDQNDKKTKSSFRGNLLNAHLVLESSTQLTKGADAFYDLALRLLTGVRHQIRLQLSSRGAPVVGDALYGSKFLPDFFTHPTQTGLHCAEIELKIEGLEKIQVYSPPPWNKC